MRTSRTPRAGRALRASFIAFVFLAAPAALAQPLPTTAYQGYLEQNDTPVNDPAATLTFRLFRNANGGAALWTETKTNVTITDGVFNVALGTSTPLVNTLFDGLLFLSTAVGGGGAPQLSPRTVFRTVPYARTLSVPARVTGAAAQDDAVLRVENTASVNNGAALRGVSSAATGPTYGLMGEATSPSGVGVHGRGSYGVVGLTPFPFGTGVYGWTLATTGPNYGVFGESYSPGGYGVVGQALPATGVTYGVFGWTNSTSGFAGYFDGQVTVTGTLTKGGGAFQIDHPLDPENRILRHSFVESPDMMNVYNGNVTTDARGYAVVMLPDWFEALNRDFRYGLTVIGQFAQAIVAERVHDNRFVIQTDKPGVEVSWQVTGIRQDAWAEENRIVVEQDKPAEQRGRYLHPAAFGLSRERGVGYDPEREALHARRQEEHTRRGAEVPPPQDQ